MAIMAKAITLTNYAHWCTQEVACGLIHGTMYDLRYLCLDLQISQTVYGGHDSKNMEWD